jgi:ubiquinone/menaquinone biosynthesis C-methylase UbiE
MITLTELANIYGSDKGTTFVAQHGYTEKYPTYLPKEPKKCLEIGVRFGPSVRMWRDYFPTLTHIYGIDLCIEMSVEQFKSIQSECSKFKFFVADQSNKEQLKVICDTIGDNELDFIMDDGSHMINHQQISLGSLFKLVKPGGVYIIEDVNIHGGWNTQDQVNYSDATYQVLDNFLKTKKIKSPYITEEESIYLESNIKNIHMEIKDDPHNFICIYKND